MREEILSLLFLSIPLMNGDVKNAIPIIKMLTNSDKNIMIYNVSMKYKEKEVSIPIKKDSARPIMEI